MEKKRENAKERIRLLGDYLCSSWRTFLLAAGLCLAYNLYFVLLLQPREWHFLTYLNGLVAVAVFLWFRADHRGYCRQVKREENRAEETAELREQVNRSYAANCDLQDYITKWCHEVKIPLSAALLLAEKMDDCPDRRSLRQQLERINSQLKNALLGCKVQSSLFDIKLGKVRLADCVRESVRNNQFFLIQNHFELRISDCGETVYTDKSWLVYVLDQLLGNAIKYKKTAPEEGAPAEMPPVLKIWTQQKEKSVCLYVEDNGEGIAESDIRRIFEKGYTGQGRSNGQYKSTGMGLYMVSVILEKLGHEILVESAEGEFTRFQLRFEDDREYFFRE